MEAQFRPSSRAYLQFAVTGSAVTAGRIRGGGGAAIRQAATAAVSADTRGSVEPAGEGGDDMSTSDISSDECLVPEEPAPFENFDKEVDGTWNKKTSDEVKRSNFGISCGYWGGNPKNQTMDQEDLLLDII